MRAGGEVHLFHCMFEVARRFGIELAMLAHQTRVHRGVGRVAGLAKAFALDAARGDDALADRCGCFAVICVGGQLAEIDERDLDMQVDAI